MLIYLLSVLKKLAFGDLAQLGERHPYKVDVTGSSPVVSTSILED